MKTLVLACGALAGELVELVKLNDLTELTVDCLPASLHHKPALIPDALRDRLSGTADDFDRIVIGYGDCGTNGDIDEVCDEFNAVRVPGDHCFEFFAGRSLFAELQHEEVGTFYLTDFFARHFELFVLEPLGIVKHPELEEMYFGNYRKIVYISQAPTAELMARAQAAAQRLNLDFEHHHVGYGDLQTTVVQLR